MFRPKANATPQESSFWVSELKLTDGSLIDLIPESVVLLVGPNNSGKSTLLRELLESLEDSKSSRKIVKDLKINSTSQYIISRITTFFRTRDMHTSIGILNNSGGFESVLDKNAMNPSDLKLDIAARAFALRLDSAERLKLSDPTPTIDIHSNKPVHPYHFFMLSRDLLRRFAKAIHSALGLDFTIVRIGSPVRGYVGDAFANDRDSIEADQEVPGAGETVETQGDGIRSYVGIAAEFFASTHPLILLDEPEAFLHPPQARKLGKLIIETVSEQQQTFIATHSSDFLQGVIAARSQRVQVIRLTRNSGAFRSYSLSNDKLKTALSHPSIANSNLLDSLFFTQTVLCEGDADCGLFDWITRELAKHDGQSVDRFWFSSGGKYQTPKLARILSEFGIDYRVILDLDAILDWSLLTELSVLRGFDISPYKKRIEAALKVLKRPDPRFISAKIRELVSTPAQDEEAEAATLRAVARSLESARRSHPLKQYGLSAFNNGQERKGVQDFLANLATRGVILLPRGELESYVPKVGLHGPGWAAVVSEQYEEHEAQLRELLADILPGLEPA